MVGHGFADQSWECHDEASVSLGRLSDRTPVSNSVGPERMPLAHTCFVFV